MIMNNTKHTKEQIRERIQQKKILFDGAFGTYYGGKYDTRQLPELANLEAPERVKEIHREYLEAGAQILRTNTFAANSFCMDIPREQIGETLRSVSPICSRGISMQKLLAAKVLVRKICAPASRYSLWISFTRSGASRFASSGSCLVSYFPP